VKSLPIIVLAACHAAPGHLADVDAKATSDSSAGASDAVTWDAASIDPAGDGPSSVSAHVTSIPGSATGRTVAATVFVPDGAGPFPLVVISPGFQMARTQYVSYARHFASWGVVAILTDYADQGLFADHQLLADDVSAVIDFALAQTSLPIHPSQIALAGHSLGGDISVLAATGDHRVRAIIGWDPVDGSNPSVVPEKMSSLTAALAVIGETTDSTGIMACAPASDDFAQFYAATASPALAMTISGADHMDWVDDPGCGLCGFCAAGSAPADRARSATRRLDVAWLRARLVGDASMMPWLTAPPEVAAGIATVETK
jgi:dienelactone hydrolase